MGDVRLTGIVMEADRRLAIFAPGTLSVEQVSLTDPDGNNHLRAEAGHQTRSSDAPPGGTRKTAS